MLHGKTRRTAFTLVELLVVIAIIGILVSLLLPAVNSAREAARRTQCTNSIRQAALAILNYESANRSFPAGAYSCCWGTWLAAILPYIEESGLAAKYVDEGKYDVPDSSYRYSGWRNLPVTQKFIEPMICPSDNQSRTTLPGFLDITSHSYAVNMGNTGFVVSGGDVKNGPKLQHAGVNFGGAPFTIGGWTNIEHDYTRIKEITDGLSNTLMLSEVIQGQGNDLRGFSWWGYAAGFTSFMGPNTAEPDVMQSASYCDARHPANPPCVGPHSISRPMMNAARSRHPGGVMTANCDGSTTFVSNDVSINVWRALSTSKGHEIISGDEAFGEPPGSGGGGRR